MRQRGSWDPSLGDKGMGERGGWPETLNTQGQTSFRVTKCNSKQLLTVSAEYSVLKNKLGTDEALTLTPELDKEMSKYANFTYEKHGFEVVHTFEGSCGMEFSKHVVFPLRQLVPRSQLRGWIDDFGPNTEDVLVLEGETHDGRKAVCLCAISVRRQPDDILA